MTAATLNIRVSPRRMLAEREAAEYIGVPLKRFGAVCHVRPVEYVGGILAYDMRDLDRWIEAQKAGDASSDDEILRKLE
jgi:hypothetical protein